MSSNNDNMTESSPAVYRFAVLALSVLAGLSALPWMYLSIGQFGGFAWGLFGFELMVLLGAIMTAMVCLGRIRVAGAFPLAVLCLVGTLVVASVFGIYVDARNVVGSNHPSIAPWVNRTLMFYLLIIAGLSVIAMLDVYRRSTRSWGLVLLGGIFLVPVIASVVYIQQRGMPTITDASGELNAVRMIGVIIGGLIFGIFLSIGGHFMIRSFEVALPEKTAADEA